MQFYFRVCANLKKKLLHQNHVLLLHSISVKLFMHIYPRKLYFNFLGNYIPGGRIFFDLPSIHSGNLMFKLLVDIPPIIKTKCTSKRCHQFDVDNSTSTQLSKSIKYRTELASKLSDWCDLHSCVHFEL